MTKKPEKRWVNDTWPKFLPLLVVFLTAACQSNAFANKENEMITLNKSIWQLVEDVQSKPVLSLEYTEQLLAQRLMQRADKSNTFFKFYEGGSTALAGQINIVKIDLRIPQQGAQSKGLLLMNLEGECTSLAQVRQQYPGIELTEVPRGRSLNEATGYTANTAWGTVGFGFQENNPECLAYVVLKPV